MEDYRHTGWRERRDGLFRRLLDELADDYVRQVEDARALGREISPLRLSCEIEDGRGMVAAEWTCGDGARADAWGAEEYLPNLSRWLSDALSRHGMWRIEEEAERRIREADMLDEAQRRTEDALKYSNMWY